MPFSDRRSNREALQRALNAALRLDPPLVIDGELGPLSAKAIIAFRTSHGLSEAAVIDSKLLRALNLSETIPMDSVLATVKSAWASKINWTLAAGVIFNALTLFGINVPSDVKDAIFAVGNGLVLIVAWIIRTWFTTSITAASAKKL